MNKKKNRFPAAVCQVNDGAWVASWCAQDSSGRWEGERLSCGAVVRDDVMWWCDDLMMWWCDMPDDVIVCEMTWLCRKNRKIVLLGCGVWWCDVMMWHVWWCDNVRKRKAVWQSCGAWWCDVMVWWCDVIICVMWWCDGVCVCARAHACVHACPSLSLCVCVCVCVCRYLFCFAHRLKGDEEAVHAAALRGIQVSYRTHAHRHRHAQRHTRTRAHTHAHTHVRARAHTHTYTP